MIDTREKAIQVIFDFIPSNPQMCYSQPACDSRFAVGEPTLLLESLDLLIKQSSKVDDIRNILKVHEDGNIGTFAALDDIKEILK